MTSSRWGERGQVKNGRNSEESGWLQLWSKRCGGGGGGGRGGGKVLKMSKKILGFE